MVDQKTLDFLDDFEGIEENFFSKKLIDVKDQTSNELHEAYCYVLEDFNESLLDDEYLISEYDTNNKLNLPYKKEGDTPSRTNTLVQQVKKQK